MNSQILDETLTWDRGMPLDAILGHFQLMDQGGFISHTSDSQEITVFLFVHDLVFPYPFGFFIPFNEA